MLRNEKDDTYAVRDLAPTALILKDAIEKTGKLDRVAVARTLHGLKISAAKQPGVLMDVSVDANGDLDRESFIVEVKDGKQVVKETLPALNKK